MRRSTTKIKWGLAGGMILALAGLFLAWYEVSVYGSVSLFALAFIAGGVSLVVKNAKALKDIEREEAFLKQNISVGV